MKELIRPYEKGDMEPLVEIWLAASVKAHDFVPAEFWEEHADDLRNVYLKSGQTFVAEEILHAHIIGFISLEGNYIAALFVDPHYQNKGVGHALLEYVKLQHKILRLHAYAENKRAIAFYERNGFHVENERIDTTTGHQEIGLVWNLTQP